MLPHSARAMFSCSCFCGDYIISICLGSLRPEGSNSETEREREGERVREREREKERKRKKEREREREREKEKSRANEQRYIVLSYQHKLMMARLKRVPRSDLG